MTYKYTDKDFTNLIQKIINVNFVITIDNLLNQVIGKYCPSASTQYIQDYDLYNGELYLYTEIPLCYKVVNKSIVFKCVGAFTIHYDIIEEDGIYKVYFKFLSTKDEYF